MADPTLPTDFLNRDKGVGVTTAQPPPDRPLPIRDVRVILTAPEGVNLIVVKIETAEPELHGLGCATFCYRDEAVRIYVEKHLRPLLIGRDPRQVDRLAVHDKPGAVDNLMGH